MAEEQNKPKEGGNGGGNGEQNGASNARRRIRRRVIAGIVIGAVVIAGLAVGVPYVLYWRTHASTDDAFIEAHIVPISPRVSGHVAEVLVTDNQHVEKGDLLVRLDPAPYRAALARAQAAVQSAQARQESARLSKGLTESTTQAEIRQAQAEVSQMQASLDAARATVEAAQGRVEQAGAQVAVASASADEAHAQVVAAKAQADRDKQDLERYERVYRQQAISEQDLDHARAAAAASAADLTAAQKRAAAADAQVELSRAALGAARDDLAQSRAKVGEAQAKVDSAQAALERAKTGPQQVAVAGAQIPVQAASAAEAQAAVDKAQLDLSYTEIRAPASGKVTRKGVEVGAYVQPGQGLMNLVPDEVWVIANFKETQIANIRPGLPVKIHVDAFGDQSFSGIVDSIMRGTGARFSLLPPENATGNYVKVVQRVPIKIVFTQQPDPEKFPMGPGMSVVPEINLRGKAESKPRATVRAGDKPGRGGGGESVAERSP